MISLGVLTKAHGIRGELRLMTELAPEYWKGIRTVVAGGKEYTLDGIRFTASEAIVKLKGVDDRNAAEGLRGELYLPEGVRPDLPDDVFLIADLYDCKVYVEGNDECIGVIYDVLRNGAADVWCIRGEGGNRSFMMPQAPGVVKEYALEEGRIVLSAQRLREVAVYED